MYETQTELTEAREELELVKLKLEVADQEAQAAKRQAAEATAATAAVLQAHDSPGLPSPVNRRSLSREVAMYGKLQCGLHHKVAKPKALGCVCQPPLYLFAHCACGQKHSLCLS